jgi:hypothetical protein
VERGTRTGRWSSGCRRTEAQRSRRGVKVAVVEGLAAHPWRWPRRQLGCGPAAAALLAWRQRGEREEDTRNRWQWWSNSVETSGVFWSLLRERAAGSCNFAASRAMDVSLSANPGELTRELPSELAVWRLKLRSRS